MAFIKGYTKRKYNAYKKPLVYGEKIKQEQKQGFKCPCGCDRK